MFSSPFCRAIAILPFSSLIYDRKVSEAQKHLENEIFLLLRVYCTFLIRCFEFRSLNAFEFVQKINSVRSLIGISKHEMFDTVFILDSLTVCLLISHDNHFLSITFENHFFTIIF